MPRSPTRPREALSSTWWAAAFAVTLAVLSWWSEDLARNDLERVATTARWGVICGLLALWSGVYVGWTRAPSDRPLAPALAIAFAAMLACFPVGSKDVFLYAFYGKMWAEFGRSPLVHAPANVPGDSWSQFLDAWWKDRTAAYGPLFLEQTWLVHRIAGAHLWEVVLVYKLCGLAAVVLAGTWIRQLAADAAGEGFARHCAGVWMACPLVLFEAVANGHSDAVMAALLVAGVVAFARGRTFVAGAVLAAAFWYKWYALVCTPVFLVRALGRWRGRDLVVHLARLSAGAVVLSLPVLIPLAGQMRPLIERVLTFENIRVLFPTELPPTLSLLFQGFRLFGVFGTPGGTETFDLVRFTLLGLGLLWVSTRRLRDPFCAEALAVDMLWSLCLFFGLAVTMLWPWHLLPLCALALCSGRPWGWSISGLLTAVGLLSYPMTFSFSALAVALCWGALALLRHRAGPRQPADQGSPG